MTNIFPSFGNTKYVVENMTDCVCIDETVVAITDADVGGVRVVTATWPAFNCVFDGQSHYVAAGSINYNSADVATPTTYYMYFQDVAGTPTAKVSTSNPGTLAVPIEFFVANIVRFKSVGGVATYYFNKYPSQDGVYELAHNLKGDVMYYDPMWISGLAPSIAAGGKVSTASGWVRFPGNEPRETTAITNGALMLDDESGTVVGLDNIATYSDGVTAIAAGDFVKLLVGVVRDKGGLNAGRLRVMRQSKPGTPYATRAAAWADAENMAATGFGIAYRGAITPLMYVVTEMGAGATSDFTQTGAYPTGDIVDLRETGLTGAGGGGGAGVTSHSALSDLANDDHTQYLLTDGTRALTGNWTVGAKNITSTGAISGNTLVSTVAVGTAPITTTSTTMCTNVNADRVDGVEGADILVRTGGVPLTADWDAGSYEIRALTFESDIATGVGAPFTVASAAKVTNLNADTVDGVEGANIVTADGLTALSGNWAVGAKSITGVNNLGATTVTASGLAKALTFESTQATGTAPLVVASETVVANLNASKLEGNAAAAFAVAAKGVTNGDTHDHSGGDGGQIAHSTLSGLTAPADDHTQYLLADGTRALSGNWNAGTKSITTTSSLSGSTLVATLASGGAAPMTITSTTKVTNLNADMLDGLHDTSFLKADGSVTATGNFSVNAGVTFDGVDVGDHAANVNAHHNAITLSASGDTLLSLSTQEIGLDTQTANYVLAGPTSGAAAAPTFRAVVASDIDIARTQGTLTLAAGQNDNVALTDGVNQYVVTGPGNNAFGFSGFTGGVGGRRITILNDTIAKNMTAYHTTTSTAANQIWCSGTLANTATGSYGLMEFVYYATLQKWVLTSLIA
jgi:hypothetical protein